MEVRAFGALGQVSALTLGGGGLGQLWGPTSRGECVATVRAAVDAGIIWLDVAPSYGNGEAEEVIGEAFAGALPAGVRISTKCRVGSPAADEVEAVLRDSLLESLRRLRIDHVDLYLVHNLLLPEGIEPSDAAAGTPRTLLPAVVGAFGALEREGLVGAWGITGIGVPDAVLAALTDDPQPAAVQCSPICSTPRAD